MKGDGRGKKPAVQGICLFEPAQDPVCRAAFGAGPLFQPSVIL
jgi:hypothetical protein